MRADDRYQRISLPAAIAGTLLVAGILRLAWLPERGFLYWDEAKFALEGLRFQQLAWHAVGRHADLLIGKSIGTAKPTHALLIALCYVLLGVHDYVPLLVNALASVAGVAITYCIGRRLFTPWIAVMGALLLAVSEYDVIYARSGLSESDATAFFLVGILVWLDSESDGFRGLGTRRPIRLFAAAVLLGLSFTCNYRLIVYLGIVVAADLVVVWRHAGARAGTRRLVPWIFGLAMIPLIWQIVGGVYAAHGITLFRNELTGASRSYLEEVRYQLHEGKQSVLHFDPGIYLQWWVLRQGWPASLLLAAGALRTLVQRNASAGFATAMVAFPYAVFVFAPFTVPRNLVPSLPFASMLAAWALISLLARPSRFGLPALLTALAITVIVAGVLSWQLSPERSGFAEAASYVNKSAGGRSVTTTEIMVFYLNAGDTRCNAPGLPTTLPDLRAEIRAGYHYAVVDRHHHSPIDKLIKRFEPIVRRFSALGPVTLGESPISSENGDPPRPEAHAEYVNIYRLDPARLPPGPVGKIRPCYPDRVV